MLKASLHIHIQGDPRDYIRHTGFDLIKRAHELKYEVLAITCHNRVVATYELKEYAKKLGILLISGIEINLGGDVLILNATPEAESLKTLEDLRTYRLAHPEIFTIAAHPFFPIKKDCLQNRMLNHPDVFDAIEHCWFYASSIDYNQKAKELAKKWNKPYIATSDIHLLEQIEGNHILIDAEKNIESIFESLRKKQFKSIAHPQGIFQMFWTFAKMNIINLRKHLPFHPSHSPSLHEKFHSKHQTKSCIRPETIDIPGKF